MTFGGLMSVPIGRFIRAVVGLVLIALGFFRIGGTGGRVVGIVGFVPLSGACSTSALSLRCSGAT
jgi:hypothetical protein